MKQLLNDVVAIAERAGREILDVYDSADFAVETKGDGSPLTLADRRAHKIIESSLGSLTPDIPVLSEESGQSAFDQRLGWQRFWLVDPLDGTKEFVKRNGEFTVNIALIEDGQPVLGVVHTPVQQVSHFAEREAGAFRREPDSGDQPIRVRPCDRSGVIMVASRSHAGAVVEQYQAALTRDVGPVERTSMGSSLKLCLVAEGRADIYPRLAPTSEWDTAAAHAVVTSAGGSVTRLDGTPLVYNKPDILNPWFLVGGDQTVDWVAAARGIEES